MNWGAPHFLWLLNLVWGLWIVLWLARRRRRVQLGRLAESPTRAQLLEGFRPRALTAKHLLWLLALASLIVALARPQWGFELVEVRKRGLDILFVIDTSNSMLATDIKPSRLDKAKRGILDFVGRLEGDRVGLVAFAGDAFLQCPLTADYPAFQLALGDVQAGIIQHGGTDIGRALETARESFEEDLERDRVIVLVTDGEDHEGRLGEIGGKLGDDGAIVYAIGVGTTEGTVEILRDGAPVFLKNEEGNAVNTALQEDSLHGLATATGGFYLRATPTDFGLETVYDQGIDTLKRDDSQASRSRVYHERYGWFLGLTLLLLLWEASMSHGRWKQH